MWWVSCFFAHLSCHPIAVLSDLGLKIGEERQIKGKEKIHLIVLPVSWLLVLIASQMVLQTHDLLGPSDSNRQQFSSPLTYCSYYPSASDFQVLHFTQILSVPIPLSSGRSSLRNIFRIPHKRVPRGHPFPRASTWL